MRDAGSSSKALFEKQEAAWFQHRLDVREREALIERVVIHKDVGGHPEQALRLHLLQRPLQREAWERRRIERQATFPKQLGARGGSRSTSTRRR